MTDKRKIRAITKAEKNTLLKEYPVGCRIRLIQMDDSQAPDPGTCGTVMGVDDMGDLLMRWDNGSSLKIILDVDKFEKVESVETEVSR